MNTRMPKQARPTREDRPDEIAVDRECVMDLPPREAMSLFTMPTLNDPTATGTTGTTGPTTTSPTTTGPTTTSPSTTPTSTGGLAIPTDTSSLPIVSKFDPSRLGII